MLLKTISEVEQVLFDSSIRYKEISMSIAKTTNFIINICYFDIQSGNYEDNINNITDKYINIQFNLIKTY